MLSSLFFPMILRDPLLFFWLTLGKRDEIATYGRGLNICTCFDQVKWFSFSRVLCLCARPVFPHLFPLAEGRNSNS
ncbi:hypothetical protein POPTR_009G077951v4 [Populus trichocarpa]|uniref:Uncharacterized protein n=1 Tax=Populus trichocarpa TaxID=3694 RepID=A0ACC0SH92_POPTR|nr:hypothetical protein POPTR_009G077951v4 [Populus trichocarpa]